MYKILLVDDEKLVLKSLEYSVDWGFCGFEIVGTANSAMEALAKIDELLPDVVFTDIQMPGISGLELLQMIRQKYPNMCCVVISGYAEFGYVKKAMELECVGYCLKPFDGDEIEKLLKQIRKRLDSRMGSGIHAGVLADYMMRNNRESVAYMEKFYQAKGICFENQDVFAACILGPNQIHDLPTILSVPLGRQKQVALVRLEDREKFFRALNFQSGRAKLHIGCSHRIASAADAPHEIREAHRCAFQFFCEGEWVWRKEAPDTWEDRKVVKKFQTMMMNGEDGIRSGFQFLREHFKMGSCSIDAAIMVRNIVETTWSDVETESAFTWDYDSLLAEYQRVEDMLDDLEGKCILLLKSESKTAITNRTFRDIYDYVCNNFCEPITASSIAAKFYINNCYLSQLFKREIGKTFTEFLTEKRIQYACTLLRSTDKPVSEIADQSGFSDYAYFARVFRKMKNCTPTEYRSEG